MTGLVHNKTYNEELPVVWLYPKKWNGRVVVWLDDAGKSALYNADGSVKPAVLKLVNAGATVLGADLLFRASFCRRRAVEANPHRRRTRANSPATPSATTTPSSPSARTTCSRSSPTCAVPRWNHIRRRPRWKSSFPAVASIFWIILKSCSGLHCNI